MRPDSGHQPQNRSPDDHYVDRRQWQVSQPELNRREDQIGDQINSEGQGHQPAHFTPKHLHENKAEADQNHRIQDLPDQPNRARSGCPRRFGQSVIPGHPVHLGSNSGRDDSLRPPVKTLRILCSRIFQGRKRSLHCRQSAVDSSRIARSCHFAYGSCSSTLSATCLAIASFPMALK